MKMESIETSEGETESFGLVKTEREGIRPLFNELILDKIAKHLPHYELKIARGVCSEWYRGMLPRFQRTTFLCLARKHLILVESELHHEEVRSMGHFVDAFNCPPTQTTTTTSVHHSGSSTTTTTILSTTTFDLLQLKSFHVHYPAHLNNPLITNWLSEYGVNLTNLTIGIDDSILRSGGHDRSPMKPICQLHPHNFPFVLRCCPNLKILRISPRTFRLDVSTNYEYEYDYSPTQTRLEMLQVGLHDLEVFGSNTSGRSSYTIAPNIKNEIMNTIRILLGMINSVKILRVINMPSNSECESLNLSLLSEPRPSIAMLHSLTTLDFTDYKIDLRILEDLCELELKNLKCFKIGSLTNYTQESVELVQRFVVTYRKKLESLHFWRPKDNPSNEFLNIQMNFNCPFLSILKVSVDRWDLGSIRFVHQFPNLKILNISTLDEVQHPTPASVFENLFESFSSLRTGPHVKLKKFHFHCTIPSGFGSQKVMDLFPNLEYIEMFINFESLESTLTALSSGVNLTRIRIGVFRKPGIVFSLTEEMNLSFDLISTHMSNYSTLKKSLLISHMQRWDGTWDGVNQGKAQGYTWLDFIDNEFQNRRTACGSGLYGPPRNELSNASEIYLEKYEILRREN